jgi:hypothetical protein
LKERGMSLFWDRIGGQSHAMILGPAVQGPV